MLSSHHPPLTWPSPNCNVSKLLDSFELISTQYPVHTMSAFLYHLAPFCHSLHVTVQCVSHFITHYIYIDPLRVTSRGARGEPHWRTTRTGAAENVQRPCLQLKNADIRFAIFLQLQYVGPSIACFEISLSWLELRYSHGVKVRFSVR